MSESARKRGQRVMQDVCGVTAPSGVNRFVDMTVDHLFAEVWSNEDLSIRDRRLVVLGILGATGDVENLRVHVTQALRRGDLNTTELDEVVVQITHYAGWPRGASAMQVAREAVASVRASAGGDSAG